MGGVNLTRAQGRNSFATRVRSVPLKIQQSYSSVQVAKPSIPNPRRCSRCCSSLRAPSRSRWLCTHARVVVMARKFYSRIIRYVFVDLCTQGSSAHFFNGSNNCAAIISRARYASRRKTRFQPRYLPCTVRYRSWTKAFCSSLSPSSYGASGPHLLPRRGRARTFAHEQSATLAKSLVETTVHVCCSYNSYWKQKVSQQPFFSAVN